MNDRFSWKRFGRLVRAELRGERRTLLLKLGGFVVFCMVMYMLWNVGVIFGFGDGGSDGGVGYAASRFCVAMAMGFIVYFNLSGSFKRYFSTGRAVETFMVPAARSEKFLYAVLKNMVVVPLIVAIIFLVNDLFWGSVLGFESVAGDYWKVILYGWDAQFALMLFLRLANGFALMAFFLAGAVAFRKQQYLWTLLAFFILNVPLIILLQLESGFVKEIKQTFESVGGIMALNGITLCWAILWLYVAWRRFSTLPLTR